MKLNITIFLLVLISISCCICYDSDSDDTSCLNDPTSTSCISYKYPSSNATADIGKLCSSMSEMVVCSIQSSCQKDAITTGICDPWSMLADSCSREMSGMSGCSNYKLLCSTNGSVVESCTNFNSIENLPTTKQLNSNVFSICQSMSMDPCMQCPISNTSVSAYLKCNLLSVYSQLCMQMPDMTQCSQWKSLCVSSSSLSSSGNINDLISESKLSDDFCSLPVQEQTPMMRMFFHTGIMDYVLFETWVPRTIGQFVGYWFLCFFFAIIFEGEKSLRSILEKRWDPNQNKQADESNLLINDSREELLHSKFLKGDYPRFSYRDIIRGFLHGLELTMSYLIMLVAMTFNVGLFFSVIAGTIVGNILFGRFRSYKPKLTCCD